MRDDGWIGYYPANNRRKTGSRDGAIGRLVAQKLLTSVVGSYPQPDWLIDRALLTKMMAPRVRVREVWRVAPEQLEDAQDDATLEAIRDQEHAGVDIITDGEIRRESYSNRFANALDGIDLNRIGEIVGRTGNKIPVPIVSGPIKRRDPVEVRDARFLRASTDKMIKVTVPGPFTMAQQAVNEYYADDASLALAYAEAVNEEVHELFEAGADVVQLDEPWLQARDRSRTPLRDRGDQPRARRRHGHDGAAPLLRSTPRWSRTSPRRVTRSSRRLRGVERETDLDRSRAAQAEPRRATRAPIEDRACRRARFERPQRRDSTPGRDANSRRARSRAGRTADRDARLRHEVLSRDIALGKLKALVAGAEGVGGGC